MLKARAVFLITMNVMSLIGVMLETPNVGRATSRRAAGQTQNWNERPQLVAQLGHSHVVHSVALSADGKYLVTGSFDQTAKLWEVETGRVIRTFTGHSGSINLVALSRGGRYLATCSSDATTRLWNLQDGKELCRLISFADGNWAVTDSEGRYDASNGGDIEGLHWVVGNETIDLKQLKDRYYDPGLLGKIMGSNKEPLRNVTAFTDVKLYPKVELKTSTSDSTKAEIKLTNRGGGIGKVKVFVNGKEVLADARGSRPDVNAKEANLQIDLNQYRRLMLPSEANDIEVIAYNGEEYLASRSARVKYTPSKEATTEPPQLWVVVAGVSDYQGDGRELRDLSFAARDAEAIYKTLTLAGEHLFPGRVHARLFTTANSKPEEKPTKSNITAALREIAAKAKATDVFIFYLAGHGVSYGGQDGDFYFLTMDAATAELKDPQVRTTTSLSSEEIANLSIQIPALKQVMILDTCASGKLIEKLTESRSIDSSTIRAWDRMKDRAGLWVLAGCAADAVSYESSRYGQGVLTYSLLQGLKQDWDKVLRKDEKGNFAEYVDVSRLFKYSADEVPRLAQGIGGIQRPLIARRKDAGSFDIGRILSGDRAQIPLASRKPVYLRSSFQLEGRPRDPLELTRLVDEKLREASTRGLDANLVFWDVREHPGAYRVAGLYRVDDTRVAVKVYVSEFVQENGKIIERDVGEVFTVEGQADNLERLIADILLRTDKLKK